LFVAELFGKATGTREAVRAASHQMGRVRRDEAESLVFTED
jgi:hypothetical protein